MSEEITTKDYVMMGLLLFMLVIAGVQAVQIGAVQEQVDSGSSLTSAPASSGSPTAAAAQASPTMVGGC